MFSDMFAQKTFPAVGPLREYQEKWMEMGQNWLTLQQSQMAFTTLYAKFWQNVFTSFPNYLGSVTKAPKDFNEYLAQTQSYLRFLDENWEKVMRSDEYAKKSADHLHALLTFHKSMETCYDSVLKFTPLVSKQQLQQVGDQMHEMRKEIRALKAKLEERVGE